MNNIATIPFVLLAKRRLFAAITILFCFFFVTGHCETLILERNGKSLPLKGTRLEYYEDLSGKITIDKIQSLAEKFIPTNQTNVFLLKNSGSAYWFKIRVKNNSSISQYYVLESYNYRIDSVCFYEIRGSGPPVMDSIGVAYQFGKRDLKHKNLTHTFWMNSEEELTIYIKMRNRYETPIELVLRELKHFTSYSLSEYFFLGLFYGSILIIVILIGLALAFSR